MIPHKKYKSYTDFALSATALEKKCFIKKVIQEANKQQRETVRLK